MKAPFACGIARPLEVTPIPPFGCLLPVVAKAPSSVKRRGSTRSPSPPVAPTFAPSPSQASPQSSSAARTSSAQPATPPVME